MPRFELPVVSVSAHPDKRSVILKTSARTEAVNYAVTLPEIGLPRAEARKRSPLPARPSRGEGNLKGNDLPQESATDLLTDLSGVEATWRASRAESKWTGWLPHLDLKAARGFSSASKELQHLFKLLRKPGTLNLRAQLNLWQMLRAATQPDSKLDFEYPSESVTVVLRAGSKQDLQTSAKVARASNSEVRIMAEPHQNQ